MSRMQRPTRPVGLYDPSYEHDACGVAFVARLDGAPTHETVQRAVVALENLEHRGAAGADPNTGDGAGILLQLPDSLHARRCSTRTCRPRAPTACACASCPRRRSARAELEGLLERTVAAEGQTVVGLARRAGRQGLRRHHRQLLRPVRQAPGRRRERGAGGRPGRVRAQAVRDPPRRRDRRRPRPRGPQLLQPHDRLQGDAHLPAAARLLPRPAGPADGVGAGARALALLHQHVPELGAGAPVPDDRPQRGDQHAARQRQLDARARVAARLRAVRRRPAQGAAGRAPRRLGLGDVRQRARAARARRPLAAARGDDDDPRGLRRPRGPARAPARLLRLPRLPDGAVGRPRRGRLHRRPRDRRDAGPQRPAPRPLAGDQGRLGRARLGDRRDGRAGREHPAQGPPAAGQAVPRRPRGGPHRRRRGGQARASPRASPTGSGSSRGSSSSTTCRSATPAVPRRQARAKERQLAFGYTQEDLRVLLGPDRGQGRGADRLDGQRRRAGRALATASRRCSPTSSSCSRRSPTRRSTRSARRS